jgi:hypothetical protein
MKEYIKVLEEQNKVLKELNEVNNKIINGYKKQLLIQEQIILLYAKKEQL